MPANKPENNKPTESVQENPESRIQKLEQEVQHMSQITQKALSENEILRAIIKAMAQLI